MSENYIYYAKRVYSSKPLGRSWPNVYTTLLYHGDFFADGITKLNDKKVYVQQVYNEASSTRNTYLVVYEVPPKKIMNSEDEEALDHWLDDHILGIYKEVLHPKSRVQKSTKKRK